MVAKIYASKMSADDYLAERQKKDVNAKGDRFDAFVMRWFRRSHTTRQAARRHMKIFLRSVRLHAQEHPRVEMFRKLCGVPDLDHNDVAFVPGLVNKYVHASEASAKKVYALPTVAFVALTPPRWDRRSGTSSQ